MFLDLQFWLPLLIIGALFVVLVKEWLEPDVAAWSAVVIVLILGLLPMSEALAALSNPAPVTVACMFILGAALEKTGVVAWLGHTLGRHAGKTEFSAILVLGGFACAVSAFLNNTAVVAVLMPVALALARTTRVSASKLLLPLSYAAILGGTCTLIGTSTNLAVQGVLKTEKEPLLGFFEFAPLGIIYAVVGLLYLLTIGRKLLPDHGSAMDEPAPTALPTLTQFVVGSDSPLIGKTLVSTLLKKVPDIDVLEVRRRGVPLTERLDELGIQSGDRILLTADKGRQLAPEALEAAAASHGMRSLESREIGVIETVVPAESGLVGMDIVHTNFRQKYAVRVNRIIRDGEVLRADLGSLDLAPGDQIELCGPTEGLERLLLETDLLRVTATPATPRISGKGLIAAAIFAIFVLGSALHDVLPGIFILPTEGMAILCAVVLLLTRSLQHKEFYQSVNWSIVLLISGMLVLGAMLEHTGTAARLAVMLADVASGAPGWLVVSLTYFVAMVLTELISNNAVAAMLTPVAIHLAHQMDLEPRPLIMAVLFAASASFSTPVGYQTNTFIYGVGGYRFSDFFRVGVPLNLLLWIVASILIPWFWPVK